MPIDPRTRGEKLAFMLAQVNASVLVSADYSLPQVLEVLDKSPSLTFIAVLATGENIFTGSWNESIRDFADFYRDGDEIVHQIDPDDPMEILFTSGTTGDPKGIVMTHRRYISTSRAAFNHFWIRGVGSPLHRLIAYACQRANRNSRCRDCRWTIHRDLA
ncbi:AMP-binding protein [Cupriavidus basilensis]